MISHMSFLTYLTIMIFCDNCFMYCSAMSFEIEHSCCHIRTVGTVIRINHPESKKSLFLSPYVSTEIVLNGKDPPAFVKPPPPTISAQ